MNYNNDATKGAVISQETLNDNPVAAGYSVGKLAGFAFRKIRDDRPDFEPDRAHYLRHVLQCLGTTLDLPTPVVQLPPRRTNYLAQNVPNPFNPSTAIDYEVAEAGDVSVRVYDSSGRFVRELAGGRRQPGRVYTATWDGRNARGARVASGVYFYRITAGSFVQTRKMVLLK